MERRIEGNGKTAEGRGSKRVEGKGQVAGEQWARRGGVRNGEGSEERGNAGRGDSKGSFWSKMREHA